LFKINKDSDAYDTIANVIATGFGFAASYLVGAFCNSLISTKQDSSFFKSFTLKAGKLGLETITTYGVASRMRNDIDDIVDFVNDLSGAMDEYQALKSSEDSDNVITLSKEGE